MLKSLFNKTAGLTTCNFIKRDSSTGVFCEHIWATASDQCFHHVETNQLMCRASQSISFYMMGILVVRGDIEKQPLADILQSRCA